MIAQENGGLELLESTIARAPTDLRLHVDFADLAQAVRASRQEVLVWVWGVGATWRAHSSE